MKRVKLRDGPLEKKVQDELLRRRLEFERHVPTLPGKPDIVFVRQKLAVFVDGDFWHGWRLPVWEHKLTPFWREKLRKNRHRDLRNFRRLRAKGWRVIRIWGHQIDKNFPACIDKIIKYWKEAGNAIRERP